MALAPIEKKGKKYTWNIKETNDPRSKLPVIDKTPVVDYNALSWLCSIQGLASRDNPDTSADAHRVFMENYHKMFVPEPKKIGFPVHAEKRAIAGKTSSQSDSVDATAGRTTDVEKNPARKSSSEEEFTYNIKDYLPLLHKERRSEDPEQIRSDNIKTLRRLIRKLPFERTASDNDRIFSILKTFTFFADNISNNVLKELCVVAQLEVWKEQDFTVFGNTGLHMVLRGRVVPLTEPHVYTGLELDELELRSPTPVLENCNTVLEVGDCFGTLHAITGKASTTRLLSVKTVDDHCELLKISVTDYSKVIVQIQQREQTEKLNLLMSCPQYKMWPRQPLQQVASLIQWISYPPNTVIVSEGYKAPFIGFIKSGECHVLRQVDVLHTLRNGKKEKKTKQVVMGKLGPSASFAEISLLLEEPITCSIVTATHMELGVVRPERLHELDEVTVQLFKQSNTRTFGELTKEDIQREYMQQEQKREWNEFKHSMVVNVINANGIRPGYGKWAK
ncbi:cyclic nucleotide-binding domain-containing protein 1-like [Babylonia areolata]|uniref:cyclic nucleotide-binding domain-containing protein 1-like n=1 Tax=Babylonia areolata TaxID=304850 RepID=UPI003FCF1A36